MLVWGSETCLAWLQGHHDYLKTFAGSDVSRLARNRMREKTY